MSKAPRNLCTTRLRKKPGKVVPSHDRAATAPRPRVEHVYLSQLRIPEGINPRRDAGDVGQLAESIRHQGLLQPLVVRPASKSKRRLLFEVVAGARRFTALKDIGWKGRIPVLVREDLGDDDEARAVAFAENNEEGRHNLTPIEVFDLIARLVEAGWKPTRIAERTGLHIQTVRERMRIISLPEETRRKVARLKPSVAREIVNAPPCDHEALAAATDDKATARDIRKLRIRIQAQRDIEAVAEEAERALGARGAVTVVPRAGARRGLASWRRSVDKQRTLQQLCYDIVEAEDDGRGPALDILQKRAMAWVLLWDRGDFGTDDRLPEVPDIKSSDPKQRRDAKRFRRVIESEAAKHAEM